jgi:hypothetical protein
MAPAKNERTSISVKEEDDCATEKAASSAALLSGRRIDRLHRRRGLYQRE